MSKFSRIGMLAGVVCGAGAALMPVLADEGAEQASIPHLASVDFGWVSPSDDFLPPDSGPGPVTFDKAHPYVPNGGGQPTYRVADLGNPILKPWVVEKMKKA